MTNILLLELENVVIKFTWMSQCWDKETAYPWCHYNLYTTHQMITNQHPLPGQQLEGVSHDWHWGFCLVVYSSWDLYGVIHTHSEWCNAHTYVLFVCMFNQAYKILLLYKIIKSLWRYLYFLYSFLSLFLFPHLLSKSPYAA